MPDAGFGNLLPVPHFYYTDEIAQREILYSTVGLTQKGCTLKENQGILLAGTVMGRVTATKLWVAYSNTAIGGAGSDQARGILRDTVDTRTDYGPSGRFLANIVLSGMLKNSMLIGLDAPAIVDFAGRQDTVLDLFQF
jgi:hypothetical protein